MQQPCMFITRAQVTLASTPGGEARSAFTVDPVWPNEVELVVSSPLFPP